MITNRDKVFRDIINHGNKDFPRESCGILYKEYGTNNIKYLMCTNVAPKPLKDFIINPKDIVKCEDEKGEMVAIVHSHPKSKPVPSQTDLVSIERLGIPWLIYNPGSEEYTYTEPTGFVLPWLGREFKHGLVDCYTLIKDYYKVTLKIEMGEYKRDDDWWSINPEADLYNANFEKEGFIEVKDGSIQEFDFLLMKVASRVENHAGVYIGNGKILHHPMNRLSCEDIYGGYWKKVTTKTLRHRSKL